MNSAWRLRGTKTLTTQPSNEILDRLESLLHTLHHDDLLYAVRTLRIQNHNLQLLIEELENEDSEDDEDL